jgi:hypothetical protein
VKEGTELFAFRSRGNFDAEMQMYFAPARAIAFRKTGPGRGRIVIPTLYAICDKVALIVGQFERLWRALRRSP